MVGVAHSSGESSQTRTPVESSNKTRLIVLEGCIDLTCTAQLRATLDDSLAESDDVCIDLSRVSSLDSTGLRELLRAQARAAQSEKKFAVVAPSAAVRRLLDLADAAGLLHDR